MFQLKPTAKRLSIWTHLQAVGTTAPLGLPARNWTALSPAGHDAPQLLRLDAESAQLRAQQATATMAVAIFGTMPPRWNRAWESVADTASMDDRRMTGRGAWMAVERHMGSGTWGQTTSDELARDHRVDAKLSSGFDRVT